MRLARKRTVKQLKENESTGHLLMRTAPAKLAEAMMVYELATSERAAVLKQYCQRWVRGDAHKELTGEEWLSILRGRLAKYEGLLNAARCDVDHPVHVSALRTWNEYRLTLWLQSENCKGIAVPSGLLADKYRELFGMGPHGPHLTKHLETFLHQKSTKHWMTRWRKAWGITYSKCSRATPVAVTEIQSKAASASKKKPPKTEKGSGFLDPFFGTKFGTENRNHSFRREQSKVVLFGSRNWCNGGPISVPNLGPKTVTKNLFFGQLFCEFQVHLFRRWVRYLMEIGMGPDRATWINMDETSVPYHVGGRMGNRMLGRSPELRAQMKERASLAKARKHLTLMATVTTSPEVQIILPQTLVPRMTGEKKKWEQWCEEAVHHEHATIAYYLQAEGWVNEEVMLWWVRHLRQTLDHHDYVKPVVLVLDVAAVHLSARVLNRIKLYGWCVLVLPAKLTYLLQPLDVYVFGPFKKQLYEMQARTRIRDPTGESTFREWVSDLRDTIREEITRKPVHGFFTLCGMTANIAEARGKVGEYATVADDLEDRTLPTEAALNEYLGRGSKDIRQFLFPVPWTDRMSAASSSAGPQPPLKRRVPLTPVSET